MFPQDEYKIKLEVFEGPLDLLLYLIKKNELDIYNIPIEIITNQYMEYLGLMRLLDLDIAGDFLVMASTLMMIKSRMLLPPEERTEEEVEEGEDPRWELIRQLVEYKQFKDAAGFLEKQEAMQRDVFAMGAEHDPVAPEPGLAIRDVSIFDLIAAFNEALKKVKPSDVAGLIAERFSVTDKIEYVLERVKTAGKVAFSSLFKGAESRAEIVCTFLALLELIRLRQIFATQNEPFEEIFLAQPAD